MGGVVQVYGIFAGKRFGPRRESIINPPRAGEREAEGLIVSSRA